MGCYFEIQPPNVFQSTHCERASAVKDFRRVLNLKLSHFLTKSLFSLWLIDLAKGHTEAVWISYRVTYKPIHTTIMVLCRQLFLTHGYMDSRKSSPSSLAVFKSVVNFEERTHHTIFKPSTALAVNTYNDFLPVLLC